MFGVSTPDTIFFARFPVTHVIDVDQPNQPFFKNYPRIVEQSARVATYTVRNLGIGVFRVSGAGGNPQAAQYVPSAFERKRASVPSAPTDTALAYLAGWVADSANFFSGWRWLGDAYFVRGDLPNALEAYTHAIGFFPDDFFLWAQIGDVSWEMFRTGSPETYRDRAADAWSRAVRFNPRNPQLMERLNRVKAR
jgi:cytochrome c-type biogenesis protein CcmH/NrfG